MFRIQSKIAKQENMNHIEKIGQSLETDLKMILMLELADKDFKVDIITAQG